MTECYLNTACQDQCTLRKDSPQHGAPGRMSSSHPFLVCILGWCLMAESQVHLAADLDVAKGAARVWPEVERRYRAEPNTPPSCCVHPDMGKLGWASERLSQMSLGWVTEGSVYIDKKGIITAAWYTHCGEHLEDPGRADLAVCWPWMTTAPWILPVSFSCHPEPSTLLERHPAHDCCA